MEQPPTSRARPSSRLTSALVTVLLLASSVPVLAADGSPSPTAPDCTTPIPVADVQEFFLSRGFTDQGTADGVWSADYKGSAESAAPNRPPFMGVRVSGDDLVTKLDFEATLDSDHAGDLGAWSLDDMAFTTDTWFATGDTFAMASDEPPVGRGRPTKSFPRMPMAAHGFDLDREFIWVMSIDDAGLHFVVRVRPAVHGTAWFGDWPHYEETTPPADTACGASLPAAPG